MKYSNIYFSKGFSIIEVMVGIFIFTMGLISIYALLVASLKVSDYNKNAIIAANLAREQIEILKNVRDTNYKKLQIWNQINPSETYTTSIDVFSSWSTITGSGSYYTIENDFSSGVSFPLRVQDVSIGFKQGPNFLADPGMKQYQLCQDVWTLRYLTCPSVLPPDMIETYFYRYLLLEVASYDDGTIIPETFKVTSKVIWSKRWYHEFDIKTLITDWRRI